MNRHMATETYTALNNFSRLYEDWKMLNEELESLKRQQRRRRNELIIAGRNPSDDPTVKQYDKDIRGVEISLAEKEKRLFFTTLIQIDYEEHFRYFDTFQYYNSTGAFFLYPHTSSGGKYIVDIQFERLIPALFEEKDTRYIKYDCSKFTEAGDVELLWNNLSIQTDTKFESIIYGLCEVLRTTNIVLIIQNIQMRQPKNVAIILEKFWQPLVEGVQDAFSKDTGSYHNMKLFLFLIDYTGEMEKATYSEADIKGGTLPEATNKNPIRLPSVPLFSSEHLKTWIDYASRERRKFLPQKLFIGPLEPIIQDILNNSENGDPYLVMHHICKLGKYSFEEGVQACLRL